MIKARYFVITKILASAGIFASTVAMAQSSTSVSTGAPEVGKSAGIISKGVRLGAILSPGFDAKFKGDASRDGKTVPVNFNGDTNAGFGLHLGMSNIPAEGLGYFVGLNYIPTKLTLDTTSGTGKMNIAAVEANAAVAMTPTAYFRGGFNWSEVVGGESDLKKLKGALGVQAGLGFQASRDAIVEITYSQFNQRGNYTIANEGGPIDLSLKAREAGILLGLVGTYE